MIHPLKVLISEYTVMSILMTMVMPGILVANEEVALEDGSNIVFSQSGTSDTPTTDTLTGNIMNNSGDTVVFETGIIDLPPVIIDNGGSGVIDTMNASGTNISSGSTEILSGSIEENNISTETSHTINTGSTIQEISVPVVQPVDEKIYEEPTEKHPEGEILIQFKGSIENTVGEYQIDQIESLHNLKTTETIIENKIAVMESTIPAVMNTILNENPTPYEKTQKEEVIENIINELKNDPRIAHVQRNFVYTTQSSNDPEYTKLWGLNNEGQNVNGNSGTIDADIDQPEALSYGSGKLGNEVIVAVLDTGIAYDHPDLVGNMWNGANCVSETGAILGGCIHGYDFVNNDNNPNDGHSHGTHVAGTIGAVTNNTIGVAGVSPNVKLMAVKVLDDSGWGTSASIIRGINFAKHNNARIINASIGGITTIQVKDDFDFLSYEAIKSFSGLFIAAAGNDGENLENTPGLKNFPSGFGSDTVISGESLIPGLINVISVAATNQNDNLASFSNYGTGTVHIAAPGTNIYSTNIHKTTISGEAEMISIQNGWTKNSGARSSAWTNRSGSVVSGENINISNVLWGDIGTPYVSGESSYIQKTFVNTGKNIQNIKITAWCDTPVGSTTDRLDILISTGSDYVKVIDLDEYRLFNFSNNNSFPTRNVDGYIGAYGQYFLWEDTVNLVNSAASFDMRIQWVTSSSGVDNAGTHYGCFVQDITLDTSISTNEYGYKNGTSMATPHVAGAAALAWNYKPNASIEEVRNAILSGGDSKNSLVDKVMSGKRLNVFGMLQAMEIPNILEKKVTLSGESIAIIDYTSDINTTSVIAYATGINSLLSGSLDTRYVSGEIGGNQLQHQAILTGLIPDTEYYYLIQMRSVSGEHINSEYQIPYSFHTPKLGTSIINTPIIVSGEIYLSGSTGTGILFSGSSNSGHIILINSGSTITVDIPTRGLQIIASGSWNGTISAPILINTGGNITLSGNTIVPISQLWSIGDANTTLTFSGQLVTISLAIHAPDGSLLDIYRSPGISIPYIKINTCTIQNNICTFVTDHFSYFAIGNVQPPIITIQPTPTPTPSTQSNNSGPGGGGGGGVSINNGVQKENLKESIYTPYSMISNPKGVIKNPSTELESLHNTIYDLQNKLSGNLFRKYSTRRTMIINLQNLYMQQIRLLQGLKQL